MQKINYNCLFLIALLIIFSNISGCATGPYVKPTALPSGMPGVYHRVEKGQTLWKISKMYDVDLDEIVRINRISDVSSIEIGQLIFIPNRRKQSVPIKYTSEDFIWPVSGRIISTFGQTFNNMINRGINIQPYSNHDVVASRSGKVTFTASDFGNFGNTIIINHNDGFSSIYARNSIVFVKTGENVEKGTVIAKAGSAGRDKNKYLHFEIRKGRTPQNPLFYLPR